MVSPYHGPVHGEPLAIELHNTLFASRGELIDGLANADSTEAWLDALADHLPPEGAGRLPTRDELRTLRRVVRQALHAAIDGRSPSKKDVDELNHTSTQAPRSPVARWRPDGPPVATVDVHGARRSDVVLSAFAADAIHLITSDRRDEIKACGAPGCVLLFLKNHPRREWCSAGCGNRARQARHYQRTRQQRSDKWDVRR